MPDSAPLAAAIDLGTCVRVALAHPDSRHGMIHEGVVIETVAPGARWTSARVRGPADGPSPVARFVVQTWHCRVVRSAAQMVVVVP